MIYIITESNDITTNKVLEYIIGQGKSFERINSTDVSDVSFCIEDSKNDTVLRINGKKIKKKDKVWIRRGRFSFFPEALKNDDHNIVNYLLHEENALNKSLELFLKENTNITGSYLKEVENYKLTHLLTAKKAGFTIPDTLVTSNKKDALLFFEKHCDIISKDLRYSPNIYYEDRVLTSTGTLQVTKEHLDKLDTSFFPILFQEKIDKDVELRVFVFRDKIFTMAIFSQQNEKTKTDYRNFDPDNPNRVVPFNLPEKIKNKVFNLIEICDLNTGSLDLILDKHGNYFFLEINPQGQLDWLSEHCNYYIEKEIAGFLMC